MTTSTLSESLPSLALPLGELLRRRIDRDAEIAARQKQQKIDDDLAARNREDSIVGDFFEDQKQQFVRDILAGRVLTPVKVGGGENVTVATLLCTYAAKQVTSPIHRFHAFWAEFEKWANANSLTPTWTYDHNGMGSDSWYLLCVAPA